MKLPIKTIKRIREYCEKGDVRKISEQSGISRQTITRALSTYDAGEKTIKAICEYFLQKEERIKKY